jgi:hypothetical protein
LSVAAALLAVAYRRNQGYEIPVAANSVSDA